MEQGKNFNNMGNQPPKMPKFNMNWLYITILIGLMVLFFTGGGDALGGSATKEATYTEFKQYVDKGYVLSVVTNTSEGKLKLYINPKYIRDVYHADAKQLGPAPYVEVQYGSIDEVSRYLDSKLAAKKINSYTFEAKKGNDFLGLLINLAPVLFFILFIMWMSGRMGSGLGGAGGGIFSVGKSKARMYEKGNSLGITFKDVAGQEGAKQEVEEIVEFLKNPQKYTDLGGKIPKGALLVGPPGTGKTLLAKAVAGEAGVPFFSMSGSDFVEMFVGVGASRVRDLFRQAKEKAPCIIFIDEIDAVGRARSKNPAMGGNDERENTLNALLTEMDGFGTNSGVIILAATNRVDMLDSALLRAGRFDREIHVDLPGLNERKAIFLVHLKPIKIDDTVDVDLLARQTPGFSGADIANVCNEAALIAARHDKKAVCKQDFLDAVDRIVGGLEKKTKVMTADEKRSIALHEAGHATISWFCQYANPLIKVTIVPRGQALGAAWYLPEERQITTKEQMLDEMCSLMGGRAAEELFTGHISSGAMNDLERATKSAYGMVAYLGMSKTLPNICYYNNNEYSFQRPYSESTAKMIDEEVLKIVNEQYTRAKNILMEHKEGHNALAELLIQKEVIMAEDVERIFGKRQWLSRSQEIMEDEQPKIDDTVKELPEVQAAIKEHEEKQNADNAKSSAEGSNASAEDSNASSEDSNASAEGNNASSEDGNSNNQ